MFSAFIAPKSYDYGALLKDIKNLEKKYPFCEIYSVGESVAKKQLYVIKIGIGGNKVFYNGAHHGAEGITSALLMKFAKEYCEAYVCGRHLLGASLKYLFDNVSLYIMPMVNPDGVDIAVNGARRYTADFPRLFKENGNSSDFSKWQANFNGVDLNHNYDALWELSREGEIKHKIFGPGPTRWAGKEPFSEPETQAVKALTERENFKLAMAFHSQGQVIYYDFNGQEPVYSLGIVKAITQGTPYVPDIPEGIASYGGYKDWFINTYRRVCLTVEVGIGENPLPISDLKQIYKETLPILIGGMRAACVI